MAAPNCECPPHDGVGVCAPLPLAFVRLRYFYGKRLGVADFVDEQLYHSAKTRFHNQHLHGAGIVCGLRVSPLDPNGLRVSKGAALDRCGREIVVGIDQCIDVDAWLLREQQSRKAVDPSTSWPLDEVDGEGKLALSVVLRFRECTASPEPAPRDPCACDNGGCDFGRIRESFELDLRTEAQAAELRAPTSFPTPEALSDALRGAVSGQGLEAALARLVSAPARNPAGENWLVIGDLEVALDANQKTTAIEILLSRAPLVLETQALGGLLLRALAVGFEPGALVDGAPQVLGVGLSSDSGPDVVGTNNVITFELSGPIVETTLGSAATVNQFDPSVGWTPVSGGGSPSFVAGPPFAISVPVGSLLEGQYRLTIPNHPAAPICDEKLRLLLPLSLVWQFAVDASGNVTAATLA